MNIKQLNTGKWRLLIIFIPVLVLVLAVALVAIRAQASPVQHPTGIYTTTITAADLPPDTPPDLIPVIPGDYEIEFTEDRRYIVVQDGEFIVLGRFTSNPTRIVMTDLEGPAACDEPGWATGVYQWTFENNELTLAVVQDACAGRAIGLTVRPWQKQ
jgi:hypothetical protein